MAKKIILGLLAVVVVVGGVAGMSAFEAHIINVTAKIENALAVMPNEIMFGTVFPQEYFEEDLDICLSDSFLAEDRVDDVNYVIKQKPKPREAYPTLPGGYDTVEEYCHDNSPVNIGDPNDTYYDYCYPVMCSYLSKTKGTDVTMPTDQCKDPDPTSGDPYYDCGVAAFHDMGVNAYGHLVKSVNDDCDNWVIDFDVPCFEGQCAQDWTHQGWELPAGLESEIFGCDLWIEVTGISPNTAQCADGIDNDIDGFIDMDDEDCEDPFDNSEAPHR